MAFLDKFHIFKNSLLYKKLKTPERPLISIIFVSEYKSTTNDFKSNLQKSNRLDFNKRGFVLLQKHHMPFLALK